MIQAVPSVLSLAANRRSTSIRASMLAHTLSKSPTLPSPNIGISESGMNFSDDRFPRFINLKLFCLSGPSLSRNSLLASAKIDNQLGQGISRKTSELEKQSYNCTI
ncbi:hypothetical protein AA313_de0204133 [Arthrobotrys entomopaga]|nr:hypothetical protein AA313_de0204133 [Arthrobotrys entomopaga]